MDKEITWTTFGKLCLGMTEDERTSHLTGCYKIEVFKNPCTKCNGEGYYGPDVVITTPCQGHYDGYEFYMCEDFDEENPNVYETVLDNEIYTECCNNCIEKYKNNKVYKNISVSSKRIEPKIRKSFECHHCNGGLIKKFKVLNGPNILAETSFESNAKMVVKSLISKREVALLNLFHIY